MGTVLLLDGNSLTYRAFFALPTDMATASGQVTNAVYGFTAMLINLIKDHRPRAVVVAFDRPEPTFRHEANPAYKAQREETPDILRQQMGLVREVLGALGIAALEAPGWEADDIIATVVERARGTGDGVIIVTGDRDSYQLVEDPFVRVLYNRRGVSDYALYDEAGIVERTGVTPKQYPEYAALRGDPSDNLPGVPGVGEKTAAKLITNYGGLDGIFAHASEQTPKLRESLTANEAQARMNLDLMLLRRTAPVEIDLASAGIHPDMAEVKRLFDFLEFRALYDRLREALKAVDVPLQASGTSAGAGSGALVDPSDDASQVLEAEIVMTDTPSEAAGRLQQLTVLDVAGAWSGQPGRSALLGVAVVVDATTADVLWLPAAMLSDPSVRSALTSGIPVRAHDAKPIMRSLLALGIDLASLSLDTAIAAYLIDPAESRYGTAELLERYTGHTMPLAGAPSGQLDFGDSDSDDSVDAARTALAVSRLAPALEHALDAQGMWPLYRDIENPLVRVLARMEHVGVAVDVQELRALNARFTSECARLMAEVHRVAGREFNVNSTVQLREILFEEHGLTPLKKTKTGFSTDAQTLEKLRDQWPEFIDPLLKYREFEKLRSTYGEGLLAEVAPDGRIHATFNQTVARTGRLSSDQPNLHNIPVRSDEGRQFRKAFVSAPGKVLLIADYNQIELRCIAHLAEDPGLIEAFTGGQDIHNATAARVFGVDPKSVTVDQRSKAKMVSYGLAYGMEAYGLAQRLNIGRDEAAAILKAYFSAFPNVDAYMERTVKQARACGYTETLFGRRRPIPDLQAANFSVRAAAERQAMNAGIQGLAADIFKVALVRLSVALDAGGYRSAIVLQVHDEILVESPDDEHEEVRSLMVNTMRSAADLLVPLEVNMSSGTTWAAAKG